MEIALINENEIEDVCKMIYKTCRISFKYYYPQSLIDEIIESLNYDVIKRRAGWTHFYVVKIDGVIVGCGAIGPYWGSETESSLFTIFVDPDYQGRGIGKKIIQTLESDEYFTRADRIEIPASLVALPFYVKCGYKHKNDKLIFEDHNIKLEKFNQKENV